MIPVIAVVGPSKSGKTTLIEYLISHLSRDGLRIGTIKHIHHSRFSLDTKGKDTWRHAQAGAKIVVCVAPREVAVIRKRGTPYQKLEKILDLVNDEKLDLIILEGFHSLIAKRRDIYKILMVKNDEGLKEVLRGTVDPILAIVGPCTQRKVVSSKTSAPILNLENEGEKILRLIKKTVLSN
jgi:molybdopterin-guanine dinucleotide biosynthesis protein B